MECERMTQLFLTQQILHALSRLDDLCADRRAADAVQGVVGFGDNLNMKRHKKK